MIDSKKYVGERYESKHGKYEIIEYLGGKHPKVKIRFDLTGSEVICRYDTACNGFAQDPNYINFAYVGKTYDSDYGPVTILKYTGYRNKVDYVEIRFEESGYVCEKRLKNVIEGKVKDPTYFMYKIKDKVFHSNSFGDFKIIEHVGWTEDMKYRLVKIKFIKTGTERIVRYDDAINGEVKDTTFNDKYEAKEIIGISPMQNIERMLNLTWRNMMNRCYNINSNGYSSHGAKGVTVAPEWHDYETFRRDVINIPGWLNKYNDPASYQLDKDLFQFNTPYSQTVYSKDTCVWLHQSLNTHIIGRNRFAANIYYNNSIFEVCNTYYVKTVYPTLPNYGPFNSLDAAINMLNYCYASVGLYQYIIPIENKMTQQQIFQHTDDRRIVITRVENK